MTFIGRSEELKRLDSLYESDRSSACMVYGRHKVGKTALLKRFCEGKRSVLLTCTGGTLSRTFDSFSSDLEELITAEIDNTSDLMRSFEKLMNVKKTVVIIDNYDELTELDPSAPVIIREFINKRMHGLNILLILCSASIKDVEEENDDRERPLNGAFASIIRVNPLPFRDAREFHPDMSEADRIRMYCIAGGIPLYHRLFNCDTSKENISEYVLGPLSYFRSSVMNDASELTPSRSAERIMTVLSDGPASLKEIADDTGFTSAAVMKTMDSLAQFGIVRKERPIGGKRDPVYRITDGPLLFYYRIIQPNRPVIEDEDIELSYMMLEEEMEMSYRPMFEEICKQHILKNYYCLEIGRWWGKITVDNETVQEDVDIVARVLLGNEESTLLCECGFYDRPTGMDELYALKNSRENIRDIGNTRYVMFSRSGFNDELREYAESFPTERIELVDIDSLH